jgi:hypothetical protein
MHLVAFIFQSMGPLHRASGLRSERQNQPRLGNAYDEWTRVRTQLGSYVHALFGALPELRRIGHGTELHNPPRFALAVSLSIVTAVSVR